MGRADLEQLAQRYGTIGYDPCPCDGPVTCAVCDGVGKRTKRMRLYAAVLDGDGTPKLNKRGKPIVERQTVPDDDGEPLGVVGPVLVVCEPCGGTGFRIRCTRCGGTNQIPRVNAKKGRAEVLRRIRAEKRGAMLLIAASRDKAASEGRRSQAPLPAWFVEGGT